MRIVKPSVLLLEQPISPEDVMRRIELCGRVCYKSEGKITFNSYKGFIQPQPVTRRHGYCIPAS